MEYTQKQIFPKINRLSSKYLIDLLFCQKTTFFQYPFKIFFRSNDFNSNRILITVPKKIFPKAIDRNTIKRKIRESYRTQIKKEANGKNFDIALIYTQKQVVDQKVIFHKVSEILKKIDLLSLNT